MTTSLSPSKGRMQYTIPNFQIKCMTKLFMSLEVLIISKSFTNSSLLTTMAKLNSETKAYKLTVKIRNRWPFSNFPLI